jgi:hypothetical protein
LAIHAAISSSDFAAKSPAATGDEPDALAVTGPPILCNCRVELRMMILHPKESFKV